MKKNRQKPFDKYWYYQRAVQSPGVDCQFMSDTFKKIRGYRPHVLREDFCGTFAICCEWVKQSPKHRALGIDLDEEPLNYGREHYLSMLNSDRQKRIRIIQSSVLTAKTEKVDIVAALNFSFYLFKSRLMLRRYFVQALRGLKKDGLLIVDAFGGKDVQESNEECSKIASFEYFWDQTDFDPVTHEAIFHIHFKRTGERKREKVFTYDWRVWTIPEIREIMIEAGFKRTHVYWEGTTRSGRGDGKFKPVKKGEACDGWVAYIVGEAY